MIHNIHTAIINFIKEENGATMVEYGLLIGLISVVAIASIADIGNQVNAIFGKISAKLKEIK